MHQQKSTQKDNSGVPWSIAYALSKQTGINLHTFLRRSWISLCTVQIVLSDIFYLVTDAWQDNLLPNTDWLQDRFCPRQEPFF